MINFYIRISEIMSDIFEVDDIQLAPDTTAADVEGWDSLNNIRLMAGIEAEFGIRFKTAELTGLKNVGALVAILQERSTSV
ncbi:acyl carrier protein [Sphingomonas sp. AR_OL41]|uniref:acyl carrier protein n=1 Tax=Sphingomonas sp. AR_OL41 TaxID=3042729 RepID=UPI002480378D|nr:acyl carrier protein [Sphingomonas sp. AR_OL41]MDH7974957.1 acyl carrier protein [Sphingomonas sp. AR_OL41]